MERQSQNLPTYVLIFTAPTRVLFESRWVRGRGIDIKTWSKIFLCTNLLFLFSLPWLKLQLGWLSLIILWLIPFSRVFEIAYAFYNDGIDQMNGTLPRSGLSRVDRLKLLGQSYIEIAICYGSFYLSTDQSFVAGVRGAFDALYFSWITITTTGFGDITPTGRLAKFISMTELGLGLMLIVFALGMYFSYKDKPDREEQS